MELSAGKYRPYQNVKLPLFHLAFVSTGESSGSKRLRDKMHFEKDICELPKCGIVRSLLDTKALPNRSGKISH